MNALALCAGVTGCSAEPDATNPEDAAEAEGAARVCAAGDTVRGIDVSYHNATIDWNTVAGGGVKFAFIRVSDGANFKDPKFAENWSGAKQAGVIRGVYQFFRPGQSISSQAKLVIDALKADPIGAGDLPVVLDVETKDGVSDSKVRSRMQQWLDLVEQGTGRKPMIYTAAFMQTTVGSSFSKYPLWVANYTTKCPLVPSGWKDWQIWQHSETAQIDGIKGNVDEDFFNGSIDDLLAFTGGAAPPDPNNNPPPPPGAVWAPTPGTSWQWQLSGSVDTSLDVAMYDVDLFDTPQSTIDDLKKAGRQVVCYFSAGSREDWRPDAGKFAPKDYGKGLAGWPGENWLDTRSANVRKIMQARLDLAVSKGCTGVEPDNVDGYQNASGFSLTAGTQTDYDTFLADEAHARGLSVGLKNTLDLVGNLVDKFDWALNEQCLEFSECDKLSPFIGANKAVFHVEYADTTAAGKAKKAAVCGDSTIQGFSTLIKLQKLDAWEMTCN
jgi:GH25 family lysozyme M1 (1,4-beta-N-acetylmuramidase)